MWYTNPEWWLAGVGILTFIVIGLQALETRRAAQATAKSVSEIKRQADILERQTAATEMSAKAAREGSEATKQSIDIIVAKERAKVTLTPTKLDLESGPLAIHSAEYTVFCYGTTRADIEHAWATVEVTDSEDSPDCLLRVPMPLGPVVLPNTEGIKNRAYVFGKPEGELIAGINGRKMFAHFFGAITYKDVFGNPHETKFRYLWHVSETPTLGGTTGHHFAFWRKSGQPEDNRET